MLTIDLAIPTHGPQGLARIEKMLLPPRKDVRYVVSWQNYGDAIIPDSLQKRDDVAIFTLDKTGVANNRNNAIDHCDADIILMADDDLTYYSDAFDIIINTFEEDITLDFAIFRVDFIRKKIYPEAGTKLSVPFPKHYYASNVEIAYRRKSMPDLRYYPELGIAAPEMTSGEEELLAIAAVKRGLNCRFIDKTICSHPTESTGDKITPGNLMASGFIIRILYPISCLPRLVLKAWRVKKNGNGKFFHSLFPLIKGATRAHRTLPHLPSRYTW